MKRNFVVGVFGGVLGSVIVLLLFSAVSMAGARGADVRSEAARPNTVSAATPLTSTFTYQGQLKNGGSPVNGACQMAFRLYDDPAAGSVIGSPITSTVPVTNGLFTIGLNFGNVFDGSGRWLDIQVNCGGGLIALTPRQPLTAAPYAFALPGLYTQPNATSPNIIGGFSGNTIAAGMVGGMIGGGGSSTAPNQVQADYGSVCGGYGNIVRATYGTVGGGYQNTASAISGDSSTVAGGYQNMASDDAATVCGGFVNNATGPAATVSGGFSNTASGLYAVIPGGAYNTASGFSSFAAGHRAQANHPGAFVWGDSTDANWTSTGNDQFLIRASGGVGINTANPTARLEVAGGDVKISSAGSGLIFPDATKQTTAASKVLDYHTFGSDILYPVTTTARVLGTITVTTGTSALWQYTVDYTIGACGTASSLNVDFYVDGLGYDGERIALSAPLSGCSIFIAPLSQFGLTALTPGSHVFQIQASSNLTNTNVMVSKGRIVVINP